MQLSKVLKNNGLDKNTLIVFTSDNGTHAEGGRSLADVQLMNSSGGLRGIKRDLYEGGIRVPTLVWGAGFAKRRRAQWQSGILGYFPYIFVNFGYK